MGPPIRNYILKVSLYAVAVVVLWLATVTIHEFWHWTTLTALGGQGYVTYPHWLNGWISIERWPQHGAWIVGFAGGIGVAVTFAPFWLLSRLTPTRWDLWLEAVVAAMVTWQVLYGIGEGLSWWWPTALTVGLVVSSVGGAAVLAVYWWWLWRWWMEAPIPE